MKHIKISSTDIKLFATMIKAGISPVEALRGISEKRKDKKTSIYEPLISELLKGTRFSEVFSKTSVGESKLYLNLLESGETTGSIPEIMEQIAINLEEAKARKNQIVGVLIYPTIIITMVTLLVLTLLLFIVPNILPVIAMNKEGLPFATRALVYLSVALKTNWILLLIYISSAVLLTSILLWIKPFRRLLELIAFKTPLLSDFIYAYLSLGYVLTLYQYLAASSDLPTVFKNLSASTNSLVFKKEFQTIEREIREGKPLHLSFSDSNMIPPIWSVFTKVAEQTSSYSSMFKSLHTYYKEIFEHISKLSMKLAEPLLMVTIGLIVGVLAYGIMAPLYGIMNSLK